MTDQPDIASIRARLEDAKSKGLLRRAKGFDWPCYDAECLLADALAILSLVARLQGERERTKGTLAVIEDLGRKLARPELDPSTRLLLAERVVVAARAALGEEGT